jgi:Flp pilus assembly protein TadG
MIVFIGLIGTGVDYGLFLIEETRLQNALDAASLAGARALIAGSPPG